VPAAFYAALLSSESEDQEKMGQIIRSASDHGIEVLPPQVNRSLADFSLEMKDDKKAIRFGLGAIKNLGESVAEAIVEERVKKGPFKDFQDFFNRAPVAIMNRRQAECLIRSGALDDMGATRATLFASLDSLLNEASAQGKARAGGQAMLFAAKPKIKVMEEWPDRIRLNDEKHLLGTYVTGHPMRQFDALLQSFKTVSTSALKANPPRSRETEVSVAGMITSAKEIFTKKGSKMAFATVEDREGAMEVVVFPDLFEEKGSLLVVDRLLLVRAQVSVEAESVKLLARDLTDLSNMSFSELHIWLRDKSLVSHFQELPEKVSRYPGSIKVKIHIPSDEAVGASDARNQSSKNSHVTLATKYAVQTHPELMNWLTSTFGEGSLRLQ